MVEGETRMCECCGKPFVYQYRGLRCFCSKKCQKFMHNKKRREREAQYRKSKRLEKEREKPSLSLSDIQKRAQAEHLTYGEYVKKYKV